MRQKGGTPSINELWYRTIWRVVKGEYIKQNWSFCTDEEKSLFKSASSKYYEAYFESCISSRISSRAS